MAMSAEPKAGAARLLSLSGAGAVVLVVASFAGLGGNTPGASDSAATISAYYDGHEVREMVAAFVLAASAPLFVIFGVTLALSLWQSEARRRPLWQSTLALGSAVAGVGFLIAALFHIALTQTANASGVSTGALQSLAALDEHSWVAFNSGLGVMMLGAAGTLLASRTHRVARLDRSGRGHRLVRAVRRLRRAHRQRALDHHDERAALPQPACGLAHATTRVGLARDESGTERTTLVAAASKSLYCRVAAVTSAPVREL